MMRRPLALLALFTACMAGAQTPGSLSRCATIAADAKRLACYDQLAAKPAAAAAQDAADFGAESLQKADKAAKIDQISARLIGDFTGWERNTRFELDNGQVWKCVDDREMYAGKPVNRPVVTIERGLFGAYFLAVDGYNQRAKVKRLR